jgi:hypothetical protein
MTVYSRTDIFLQKDTAKAAGQKKQAYESAYQTIEKILGLSSRLGIHELAVQCGCSEVRELAQSLLKKYSLDLTQHLKTLVIINYLSILLDMKTM